MITQQEYITAREAFIKCQKSPILKLSVNTRDNYSHVKVSFCYRDTTGELANYLRDGDVQQPGIDYADLVISNQMDEAFKDGDNLSFSYGWELAYRREDASIDLEDAELMAKTLRKIKKQTDKIEAKLGKPTIFSHYVYNIAIATKCDHFVLREDGITDFLNLPEGIAWIDQKIQSERRRLISTFA